MTSPTPPIPKTKKRKTIGLALGGGGARGLAHVGVLRVLSQAGIPIDYIAGTSMGALVGGFYAATGDLDQLEHVFSHLKAKDVIPASALFAKYDKSFVRESLFRDRKPVELLRAHLKDANIEDCTIPFAAIATDVRTGDTVALKKGNVEIAIRASIALPIVFHPVTVGDHLLMDGGFSNPVPADIVRGMGADYVIAVDVTSQWMNITEDKVNWGNMYSVVSNSLSVIEYQISREILKQADVVLRPPVLQYNWLSFEQAGDIIIAGADEARFNLRRICADTEHIPPEETPLEKLIDFIRGT